MVRSLRMSFCSSSIVASIASILFSLLLLNELIARVNSLGFILESGQRRCLKEEMRKDVLLIGDYSLTPAAGQRVDLIVRDSKGRMAFKKENMEKGKFAITSDEDDIYDFCFTSYESSGQSRREVTLEMKRGVEAANYDVIGQMKNLNPTEVELFKLRDLSRSIFDDLEDMRRREKKMRDANESINARVFYLSLFSIVCLLGLGTWQILFLRRFSVARKLYANKFGFLSQKM